MIRGQKKIIKFLSRYYSDGISKEFKIKIAVDPVLSNHPDLKLVHHNLLFDKIGEDQENNKKILENEKIKHQTAGQIFLNDPDKYSFRELQKLCTANNLPGREEKDTLKKNLLKLFASGDNTMKVGIKP